jgi:hypothetical protein
VIHPLENPRTPSCFALDHPYFSRLASASLRLGWFRISRYALIAENHPAELNWREFVNHKI